MKCKVCGAEILLKKENRYTACKSSDLSSFFVQKYFDAFDCPACGCQNIIDQRCSEANIPKKTFCEWISVEKQLPADTDNVIISIAGVTQAFPAYLLNGIWYWSDDIKIEDIVEAWMPLPKGYVKAVEP